MIFAQSFNIDDPGVFQPAEKFSDFGALASTIVQSLTIIAAVVSIIFIITAGLKYVTSSGDPKKIASATSTLTYAIIGLAVTALAFVILRVVEHFFGARLGVT